MQGSLTLPGRRIKLLQSLFVKCFSVMCGCDVAVVLAIPVAAH